MAYMDITLEPVRAFMAQAGALLPKLVLAIVILLVGWLLAKLLRLAASRGLRAINFHILTERAGVDGFLRQGGIGTDTGGVLVLLLYWLVILAALMIAFNSLGLTNVTEVVGRVALFIPDVILAVLILAFGGYFARFVERTITAYGKNVGVADAELLGQLARYAILVFVVLIALEKVHVATELVHQSFLILLAGVVLAAALAFGLGGQQWAARMLEHWFPTKDPQERKGH
ncbi:MAG: mechanosensitive ion channel family protein [Acidiferrobacterales bacterium]